MRLWVHGSTHLSPSINFSAGRAIGPRFRKSLFRKLPAIQNLFVGAALDQIVCGERQRIGNPGTLAGGDGNIGPFRPAGRERSDSLDGLVAGGNENQLCVRLDDNVCAPCGKRHEPRGLVVIILQLYRLQSGGDILIAPFQQDALLIGARADDDPQACGILGLINGPYAAVGLDEEAMQALPVSGEIELLLTLLVTPTFEITASYLPEANPMAIRPGDGHKLQIKAEAICHGKGLIGSAPTTVFASVA